MAAQSVRTKIVQVGNSRGIRIPKALLEQSGVRDRAELAVRGSSIVITPSQHVRSGWAAAFAKMHERGDDKLLDSTATAGDWDDREWQW